MLTAYGSAVWIFESFKQTNLQNQRNFHANTIQQRIRQTHFVKFQNTDEFKFDKVYFAEFQNVSGDIDCKPKHYPFLQIKASVDLRGARELNVFRFFMMIMPQIC